MAQFKLHYTLDKQQIDKNKSDITQLQIYIQSLESDTTENKN
jgi:hypothetical protein